MSWTDERIEMLKQLWEGGSTASQIAEKLGNVFSRNAVIGKAHRLGLKSRPSPVKAGDAAAQVDEKVVESLSPPAEIPAAVPAAAPAAKKPAPAPVAAPAPSPVPRAVSPAPSKTGGKTTLLELSDKICKWPIGHPGEPDFHFCGRPVQAGFPYCGEHCAIAYQAQLPRRDRTPRPLPPVVSNIRR